MVVHNSWWDRNGMAVVTLAVSLTIYLVGVFGPDVGPVDNSVSTTIGALGIGSSAGMKIDPVWSRENILSK